MALFSMLGAKHKHDHNHSHQETSKSDGESAGNSNTYYPTNENIITLVIQGLVCSFCAYATEKQIKKYDFVDKAKFGGDGVEILPEKGLARVALLEKKAVSFSKFFKATKTAGYKLKKIYLYKKGYIQKTKEGLSLVSGYAKQKFLLQSKKELHLNTVHKSVEVWGTITKASSKNNLTLIVERWRKIK